MAALKLITLRNLATGPSCDISSSNGATHCNRPPFSKAERVAFKLITSSDRPQLRRLVDQWRHTLPTPLQAEMAALK
eukprot:2021581-Karenia_brevis.AAC.1